VASQRAASKREVRAYSAIANLFADVGSVRDRYLVAIGAVVTVEKSRLLPARMKVTIVRFIRTHSIRVGTGMNWFTPRQVSRSDHDVFAKLCHGSRMRPSPPNFLQPAHQIRREPSFAVRWSVQNQVAVSEIQWPKPLVNDSLHRLERSIRVSLLPEPSFGKGRTGERRHVATFWDLLPGILLKSLYIGIVESARRILTGIETAV